MVKAWIARPARAEFDASQASQFYVHAVNVDTTTYNAPIEYAADVELQLDGRLRSDNSMLSLLAIKQLCTLLAAGLWTYVSDVGGILRRAGRSEPMLDPSLAVNAINKTLKLRFHMPKGIRGRQLIRNTATRTVDGIVGNKYKYLPHGRLYEVVDDFLTAINPPINFHAARLDGRRLAMVFLRDEPFMEYAGCSFRSGYYFSNSEVGECSVSASAAIYAAECRCLAAFTKLPHTGKTFAKRLRKKLGGVINATPAVDADALHSNLAAPLDIIAHHRIAPKPYRTLLNKLIALGLESELASLAISKAIFGADTTELQQNINISRQPTCYDLFTWLIRLAKPLHIPDRAAVERVAFKLLLGEVPL